MILARDNTSILTKGKKSYSKVVEIKLNNNKGPILKKGIKAVKTDKQNANYIITEHEAVGPNITNVHDIIFYDVPATWTMQ